MDSVTRMQKNIFPHISRIFSALTIPPSFRFVVLASFLAFVALNIWMKYITVDMLGLERINVLSSPFFSTSHVALGKALYVKGNIKDATEELLLAEQVSTFPKLFSTFTPTVLGAQSESVNLLQTWDYRRTYQDRAYYFWKTVLERTPDYRDAYIILTSISYDLGKKDEAAFYLQQAYILDPNNEAIRALALQLGVLL